MVMYRYMRPEEVLCPVRLMLQSFHSLAVLTVLWLADYIVANANSVPYGTTNTAIINKYNSAKDTLTGISYASLACLAVESALLTTGVTLFNRLMYLINIVLNFAGTILTVLFIYYTWPLGTYYAIFAVCVALPALLEVLYFVFFVWLRSDKV